MLALLPAGNLLWIVLFLLLFLSKAHYGMALAALAVFKLAARAGVLAYQPAWLPGSREASSSRP